MTGVNVYNLQKEKTSEVELRDEIFDVAAKKHVLHQVVVSQLCNKRSGTSSVKTRAEIKGSGAKLWRQKGTGRARVGSASSPTRRGGGVAFGPGRNEYGKKVPKKIKKAALCMALSDKVRTDRLVIVDELKFANIKTKEFVEVMDRFEVKKALIITHDKNINLEKSSKNVPWVKVMRHQGLNVYDILRHDHLFLEQTALEKIEEALIS